MRWHEIISETPEKDLSVRTRAMHIVETFKTWLETNAKETTLANAGGRVQRFSDNQMAWLINAAEIGLPRAYRDLYLGFTWSSVPGQHDRADGALNRGYDQGDRIPIYFATLRLYGDPTGKTEPEFSPIWEHLFHEVVHYFDYRYGVQRNGLINNRRTERIKNRKNDGDYVNDSLERNAYFQMGMTQVFDAIVQRTRYRIRPDRSGSMEQVLVSYEAFLKEFLVYFDQPWLAKLTSQNRKRFLRRLYKLFYYIKKSWPDTKEVIAAVEKLRDAERAQAERWAREDAELAAQMAA